MTELFSHEDGAPAPHAVPDAPERDPEHDAAVPAAPAPLAAGTYAVYPDGAGGFMLVLGMAGESEPFQHHIPAAMIKMAKMAGGLNFGPLSALFGR